MTKYYAVDARDILGNRILWADSYPSAKLASDAARAYKKEHPFHVVTVLKEVGPRPGHVFGSEWRHFKDIRR